MTTGNNLTDRRYVARSVRDGVPSVNVTVGTYKSKVWSGGDAPKREPPPYHPPFTYTYFDSKGKPVTKTYRFPPVKRGIRRNLGLHAYTMSSTSEYSSVGTEVSLQFFDDGSVPNVSILTNYGAVGYFGGSYPYVPLPGFSANDDLELINQLGTRVRGSRFNAAVSTAEFGEAATMIAGSAIRLSEAYRAAKRGNIQKAAETLMGSARAVKHGLKPKRSYVSISPSNSKAISSNWLELQYGWLPLLQDIDEGAKMLAHQVNIPFRERHTATKSKVRSQQPSIDYDPSGWIPGFSYSQYSKRIVAYISEPPSVAQLSGVTNPASIIWELTPFSFVADWVIPIGDWLEARGVASMLSGTFVISERTVQKCGGGLSKETQILSYGGIARSYSGSFEGAKVTLRRSITGSLAVPMPEVKPLSEVASWKRAANAIALLVTSVRG